MFSPVKCVYVNLCIKKENVCIFPYGFIHCCLVRSAPMTLSEVGSD